MVRDYLDVVLELQLSEFSARTKHSLTGADISIQLEGSLELQILFEI